MKTSKPPGTPADLLFNLLLASNKVTSDYIIYTEKEERATVIQLKHIEGSKTQRGVKNLPH